MITVEVVIQASTQFRRRPWALLIIIIVQLKVTIKAVTLPAKDRIGIKVPVAIPMEVTNRAITMGGKTMILIIAVLAMIVIMVVEEEEEEGIT